MRLVSFGNDGRVGVLEDGMVADLSSMGAPSTMDELISGGEAALVAVSDGMARGPARTPLSEVRLLAPIPHPRRNVFAVGRNYRDHAREFNVSGFDASSDVDLPDHPMVFTKAPSSVIGPGAPIKTQFDPTSTTDYEGELGVVIGRGGFRLAAETALDHVFGYTVVNDVTARAVQRRHVQWFLGKSPDTFCPMGPCIVTADEMGDLGPQRLRTRVNGEERQDAALADLIFDVPTLLATISEVMTLQPGDIIATGTPSGVGIGFDPPRYLSPGDVVEVEVEGIGVLSNPVE
jgi:2-keto-4-pentenoate hydratase/2-oxohepta-3-ene-1,7-dioic acid hydratase in catechol pathway